MKMALNQQTQNGDDIEIITAKNGEEGIAFFEMNFGHIKLIFADFEMPGLTGP